MTLRFALLLLAAPAFASPSLMPLPAHISPGQGRLAIDQTFRVALAGRGDEARARGAALRLISRLAAATGMPLDPTLSSDTSKATLVIEWSEDGLPVQALGEDESYTLTVSASQARLKARNPLGVLRGIETFLQLVAPDAKGFAIAAVTIDDQPRFPWRGFMMDACRHFMPLDVVYRNLDGMSQVKLNVFHWHLSDEQGFRAESKIFPRLQGMGSDGLFYTQDQIRAVIAYARDRGIRVIPEFDMPGHSGSWLVGYPDLAASAGPFQIGRHFGEFTALMDPTKESTYQFLDAFLGEMAGLFPDEFFHIGGDEVNDHDWKANPKIQDFIRANSLHDSQGLQAYFNKRIEKTLAKYGKHMEGWDEILNPDLPRNIVIQSWRGQKSLADAARLGFQGLLSHGYYLDLEETAATHYAVDPLENETAGLTPEQKSRILGGEAALWTEFVSAETFDSRTWPRMAAIAERFWSPGSVTDVDSMYARLAVASRRLESTGLTHLSSYPKMLRRMAGENPVEPLRVLADATEPTKGYSRDFGPPYLQQTPLNRLVDASRPESMLGYEFGKLAKNVAANRDPKDIAEARRLLTLWRDNDAALQPLIAASFLVSDDAALSKDLATAATAGLEALTAIERRRQRPAAWVKTNTATLDKMKKPHAEMMVSIVPGVEALVAASGEKPPAARRKR